MDLNSNKSPKKYKYVKKFVRRKSAVAADAAATTDEFKQKMRYYKRRVEYAIARGKVYRVIGNVGIGRIRLELHKRGFIEVVSNNWENTLVALPESELFLKISPNNEYERALLTKLLGEREPDFLWINRTSSFNVYQYVPIMNKINIMTCNFVVKDGLCELIDRFRSNYPQRITEINHPRTFSVTSENYFQRFRVDYRLTIATSTILFISYKKDPGNFFGTDGELSLASLDFALNVIEKFLKRKSILINNEDSDSVQWDELSKVLNSLVEENGKFKIGEDPIFLETITTKVKNASESILKEWPWRKHDGYTNVWLIKPARTGEGAGIFLSRDETAIRDFILRHKYKPFVIQKYLERPLLCYRTKFDFRHYFLVTIDNNYLRAWSHSTACTIKFASEPFSLKDFSEARHITNTAVQMKFAKVSHPYLPQHHMWSLGAFILYLNSSDKGYLWKDYIYPRMVRTIQTIVEASMENIELKPGRFELFGCDWMLTNDFKPYLLEINRCPSLEYYSPVSEIVVGKVTEDLVKVTVDYLKDKTASTGDFELIFKRRLPEPPEKDEDDEWLM
ncbi:tubulin glycylase 3B-like [Culicoides brevitarsis]|uniref:tubulin glycylase 3B-like n=1 Tax=Culicoides brevitarsis TaxID=469753 RepID=UPI00307C53D8